MVAHVTAVVVVPPLAEDVVAMFEGQETVGCEDKKTNMHTPMRLAVKACEIMRP